jgi:plastocyanin
MIKKLPFILFLMCAIGLVAQTTETVEIDWDLGSNPDASGAANASRTVEIGDTVKWVWKSSGHNVVSNSGANETFNSGSSSGTNTGTTFSHTFISLGTSDYVCTPHSGNMYGTITVVAEGVLSISKAQRLKFETFPNPASNNVSIQLPSGTEKATVHFYDSLGRLALSKKVTNIKNTIDVNSISSGVYILKVVTKDKIGSQKFIKN